MLYNFQAVVWSNQLFLHKFQAKREQFIYFFKTLEINEMYKILNLHRNCVLKRVSLFSTILCKTLVISIRSGHLEMAIKTYILKDLEYETSFSVIIM